MIALTKYNSHRMPNLTALTPAFGKDFLRELKLSVDSGCQDSLIKLWFVCPALVYLYLRAREVHEHKHSFMTHRESIAQVLQLSTLFGVFRF